MGYFRVLGVVGLCSGLAISSGCSATITGGDTSQKIQKNPSDVNFIQCSDSQLEVLANVSSSDLEANVLNNGPIAVRDITTANSTYVTTGTDQATQTWIDQDFDGTPDPGIHGFQLGTAAGMYFQVSTRDFATGRGVYVASTGASPHEMTCTMSVSQPAPLPPPPPSYLDCKGQYFEVYFDFTQVNVPAWLGVGNLKMGSRAIVTPTATFTMYTSNVAFYTSSGVDYASISGADTLGDTFTVNLMVPNLSSTSATAYSVPVGGSGTNDSLACQWLGGNLYAGQYGW
jgi:hypothetical protein